MKHALIVGHPDPKSFTMAMDFDPRLKLTEMADRPIWSTSPDAAAERELLKEVDASPSFIPSGSIRRQQSSKAYIDRILGAGFGYAQLRSGGHEPMLSGRQLITVTASGSSTAWLNEQGSWESLRSLFDTYLGRICGLRVRPHIHFDSITPGLSGRWVDVNLKTLATRVTEYFADAGAEH